MRAPLPWEGSATIVPQPLVQVRLQAVELAVGAVSERSIVGERFH